VPDPYVKQLWQKLKEHSPKSDVLLKIIKDVPALRAEAWKELLDKITKDAQKGIVNR